VGGIDDCLADGIFYAASGMAEADTERMNICRYHTLSQGGYGSVYDVPTITAKALGENLEKVFSGEVRMVGDGGKEIRKVASFCGAGADDSSIGFAIQKGVDAVVTADWKHHLILACYQAGVTVFVLSHYASEEYGFIKYYEKMCKSICVPCAFHREEALL
jgi:putative NIF3 family GTP cyclohydrolase 1 type 2